MMKSMLLTLCFTLTFGGHALLLPSMAFAEQSPQTAFNEAMQLAKEEKYEQSIQALRRLREAYPDQGAINHGLSATLAQWASALYAANQTRTVKGLLEEAVRVDPENGPAWLFFGDVAYYQESDFRQAIQVWKKAFSLAPADQQEGIADRIARAETDLQVERQFSTRQSAHFNIRSRGDLGAAKLDKLEAYLEGEYTKFSKELGVEMIPLTIIVYPERSFSTLNRGHDDILGFYDGRIRLGEKDLDTEYGNLILSHELAHAFLHQGFGVGIPSWVHEGYAQARAPARTLSEQERGILESLKANRTWIPLKYLERHFLQPIDDDDITRSYMESLLVVQWMLKNSKNGEFGQFLKNLHSGEAIDKAFEEAYPNGSWNNLSRGKLGKMRKGLSSGSV